MVCHAYAVCVTLCVWLFGFGDKDVDRWSCSLKCEFTAFLPYSSFTVVVKYTTINDDGRSAFI